MVGMITKLLRQQVVPGVDFNIFTGDPVDFHYFIAVFDELVEKKIGNTQGRLTRLIKYTEVQSNEMIKIVSSNHYLSLQECKITSLGEVWKSTSNLGSLPQGNQILATT